MFLSVIIPAYNVERFIAGTLGMLAAQISACPQKDEIEVIVVDDGSTDATLRIAESCAAENCCIKIISQENKGVSAARNVGMENASGKYIYFMDSDDVLADGTVDFYVRTVKANPDCQIYGFGYKTSVNGADRKIYSYPAYDGKVLDNLILRQGFLSKKLCLHICSCIYEGSFLRSHNMRFTQGVRIGEDIEFILKTVSCAGRIFYSSRICFIYQIRNDSAMQGYKTYSETQYHSFEIRRDIVLNDSYQRPGIKKFSNFWIENQLLSNIVYYLRSDFNDAAVTEKLVSDCALLKRSIRGVRGAWKNKAAILAAKILPVKSIIRLRKG